MAGMRRRRAARRDEACEPPAWVRLKAMNKLALAIATWFGCGYAPWAPGTVGSRLNTAHAVLRRRLM